VQNDAFFFSAAEYKETTTTDGKEVVWQEQSLNAIGFNSIFQKQK
jgi:hypothetical protein